MALDLTSTVPANSSRLFSSRAEALRQPIGRIKFEKHNSHGYYLNSLFDPTLILYDENYSTVNNYHLLETIKYLENTRDILDNVEQIIEIGCGHGEFVQYLIDQQYKAFGFDPVLTESSEFLFNQFWSPKLESHLGISAEKHTLYVLRCVLPHIPNPFDFLKTIFNHNPLSKVLIEFQSREAILEKKMWTQLSHDHVNLFSSNDFEEQFKLIASGSFSSGEWKFVLISGNEKPSIEHQIDSSTYDLQSLFAQRDLDISDLIQSNKDLVIYGAAGKGIVFAYSINDLVEKSLYAYDDIDSKHGLYMECSGVQVLSRTRFKSLIQSEVVLVVMNPAHLTHLIDTYNPKTPIYIIGQGFLNDK